MLQTDDCNAISVYFYYANYDYDTSAAVIGVPIAGATLGAFVNYLVSKGTPLSSFHLAGFSMGVLG